MGLMLSLQCSASGIFPEESANTSGLPERIEPSIDQVWSGHPVGFSLVTTRNVQVAAYYNAARKITLAARNAGSSTWQHLSLGSEVGWDSHNYLVLKVDSRGYLHLSGNMHYSRMNYYRSVQPLTSAEQLNTTDFMTQVEWLWSWDHEGLATYPTFFEGPNQEFLFAYRNHADTNYSSGDWYLLQYDDLEQSFAHATGGPALFNWTDNYSAYPVFMVGGGYVHCLFMWRSNSRNAEFNYRLSYMRSADLLHWTDAFGRPLALPITPNTHLTTIDDVPVEQGLLNGQPKISLDRDGAPLVAYHRYDEIGYSQIYVARPRADATSWETKKLTDSHTRWDFGGPGTLPGGTPVNTFQSDDPLDGLTTLQVEIKDDLPVNGQLPIDATSGMYVLDETTLSSLPTKGAMYTSANAPACASGIDTDNAASQSMMVLRSASDGIPFAGQHYYLRWETLRSNRDLPPGTVPDPTPLYLYRTACNFRGVESGSVSPTTAGTKLVGFMFKPVEAFVPDGAMELEEPDSPGEPNFPRAFGKILRSSAGYSPTSYAEWQFTIPANEGGDYVLGGSTYSERLDDDSFYVQVDNVDLHDDGELLDWHLVSLGRWHYRPVTKGATKALMRFDLVPGSYKLRVYAREKDAKLEYLWLTKAGGNKTPTLAWTKRVGFLDPNDAEPNEVYYATSGDKIKAMAATDLAEYQLKVNVPTGKTQWCYTLLGRTKAADEYSDSFKLSYQKPGESSYGAPMDWHFQRRGPYWTWSPVTWNPVVDKLLLGPGHLNLKVQYREAGAKLDSFMLLSSPTGPTGAPLVCD
jgi:hypothetical protein